MRNDRRALMSQIARLESRMADTQVFKSRVAAALTAVGIDAKADGWYLVVAGCQFDCEKNAKDTAIKFLGSRFKMGESDEFDVERAVGLVIAALPSKLAQKTELQVLKLAKVDARELAPDRKIVTEREPKIWRDSIYVTPELRLSWCSKGIEVTFVTANKEVAAKALELLKGL